MSYSQFTLETVEQDLGLSILENPNIFSGVPEVDFLIQLKTSIFTFLSEKKT